MQNRKFKMHPPNFIIMVLCFIGGIFFIFLGIKNGNNESLSIGGLFLLVALVLLGLPMVPIPKLSSRVDAEVSRLFPAEAEKQVLVLLTNGFTDYTNDGVYLSMLKFAKGDLQRLKKLARALNGQDDFREAYPLLEYINKKLDNHEL
jgi:hypothetical protein